MPLYKPFGIYPGEVADPEQLLKEYSEASKVVENTTSWQWMSDNTSGLEYRRYGKNGSGVIVEQRQRAAFIDAGSDYQYDATNISGEPLQLQNPLDPWPIPYLKGWQDLWNGELAMSWSSGHSELVLIGCSLFAYRLASKEESLYATTAGDEWYFGESTQPRIKFGVDIDGRVVEGSGPGTNIGTNGPEMTWANGSRQKAIISTTNSIQMLGAGEHRVSPVGAQGPANSTNKEHYYSTDSIKTLFDESEDDRGGPNHGVVVVNARIHTIRFPRARKFGV